MINLLILEFLHCPVEITKKKYATYIFSYHEKIDISFCMVRKILEKKIVNGNCINQHKW